MKTQNIKVRLEEHTRTNYIKHAKKRKLSLSAWIRQALKRIIKIETKSVDSHPDNGAI